MRGESLSRTWKIMVVMSRRRSGYDEKVSLWDKGGTRRIHSAGREKEPPSPAFDHAAVGGAV
jgi:hypothetical protein